MRNFLYLLFIYYASLFMPHGFRAQSRAFFFKVEHLCLAASGRPKAPTALLPTRNMPRSSVQPGPLSPEASEEELMKKLAGQAQQRISEREALMRKFRDAAYEKQNKKVNDLCHSQPLLPIPTTDPNTCYQCADGETVGRKRAAQSGTILLYSGLFF